MSIRRDVVADILGGDPFLTCDEVGNLFRVDSKTVARWANAGKLRASRTLGGEWRFRESDVHKEIERMARRGDQDDND